MLRVNRGGVALKITFGLFFLLAVVPLACRLAGWIFVAARGALAVVSGISLIFGAAAACVFVLCIIYEHVRDRMRDTRGKP
jgi:hypothetical protein